MKYFLTVILSDKATPAKKKSFGEKIEKLIKVFEGKVEKIDDWGEIALEHKIKGHTSGNFLHFALELERSRGGSLRERLVTEEDILRYLLVRAK